VYFLPQALYFREFRNPRMLLEENREETSFAVLASRAAGEHPGQPDPYRPPGADEPRLSSFTAQPFPPALLAGLARLFGVRVNVVFWAGSFVFPALIVFLVASIVWLCELKAPYQIALVTGLTLLVMPPPYWLIEARYVFQALAGQDTGFFLNLPYSRRYQPQVAAVFHYLAIAASLLILRSASRRLRLAAALAAGAAVGISFYCYVFSWSLLAGWFALGGWCVWQWYRSSLRLWLLAAALGLIIAIPYLAGVSRNYGDLAASASMTSSHAVAPDMWPDLILLLATVAASALSGCVLGAPREIFWAPAVLNLAAALGVVQNVVTGAQIHPFHYAHYFGRPTVSMALTATALLWLARFPRLAAPRLVRFGAYGLLGLAVAAAGVVQWHRYRMTAMAVRPVLQAQPAFEFLNSHATDGLVVHSPVPEIREALPLYTNIVPHFSVYMWTNQTATNRDPMLERIAVQRWLEGVSQEEFAKWVQSRPWEIFCQYVTRAFDPRIQAEMREMEQILTQQFGSMAEAGVPREALGGLRYAVLPAKTPISTTRLPTYFDCRTVWSDAHYSVLELAPKPTAEAGRTRRGR
jgi:hypothetical protein